MSESGSSALLASASTIFRVGIMQSATPENLVFKPARDGCWLGDSAEQALLLLENKRVEVTSSLEVMKPVNYLNTVEVVDIVRVFPTPLGGSKVVLYYNDILRKLSFSANRNTVCFDLQFNL